MQAVAEVTLVVIGPASGWGGDRVVTGSGYRGFHAGGGVIARSPATPPSDGFGLRTRQREERRSVHHYQELSTVALDADSALGAANKGFFVGSGGSIVGVEGTHRDSCSDEQCCRRHPHGDPRGSGESAVARAHWTTIKRLP